ncbi:dihydroorotate oxidase B, electron transfer subunit [Acidothermus cellulolyticus 11B]|jgi:dihydroorotate dehydrogenase electron transfer subunit|uniref:Dihydroorotate oxidase B, electron transfer subunit n=1 Tax=Acidothermus cellulolyticus (strain ATCC 43068 / DSM 8971 / 11B) TaxID=351607 RepID=A0LUF9_ACIC1|nr:dihydroorotate dehydrogenase electron transfer subunit [Acidothermus cellulolyticus]ABK53069.1 dihydroorotate oxidase B, electron transfer subunit [Acidothermus cellulolyticus 11B]MBX5447881.1 dihydroorotate dehydrogenase electron transfer subunit [Acidothermus cellulolyticus]MCL6550457.1 dihydroorotate dehydrogenase electron transfer subunit [Acidothermus cellulolyticus]
MPVQVRGEVLANRRAGAYHLVSVVAPGIAEQAKPGQFVTVAVGDEPTSMLTRRAFSIYQVRPRGVFGGTVEVVFAVVGAGTAWLAARQPHDVIDLVGPLGRPFSLPKQPATCVLVGGGYGAAPLFPLAEALRARGCRIDVILGAATEDRLFGTLEAKRMSATLTVTTVDGSVGVRGMVSDVLPEVLSATGADVVYACGPMPMLRAVTAIAAAAGVPCQVAVEEQMACGIGVCMTCVLPVIGDDGVTRMVRSCVDGPVFYGERVRFDDIGTVPADAWGASDAAPVDTWPRTAAPMGRR